MLHDLTQRVRTDERMDDPTLDHRRHRQALQGLTRLNRVSGSVGRLWGVIRQFARQRGKRELSLLDIATGSGDIPIGLYRRGQRSGILLKILAVDISDTALNVARQRAAGAGADVEFRKADILADTGGEQFDIVLCSLFLHHLEEEPCRVLLQRMRQRARHLVVVNDLVRSRLSALLVWLGSRLLSRSDIVHFDAMASVRAAFTADEMRRLFHAAGLASPAVSVYWPCRLLSVWSAP